MGHFAICWWFLKWAGNKLINHCHPGPLSSRRSGLDQGIHYSFHLLNGMTHAAGNIFIVQSDYIWAEWDISDDYNCSHLAPSLLTALMLSTQLKRKFDFEGSVPFQLSNWPSKQFGMLPEMKLLEVSMANDRPGLVLGWPIRGLSLRWALWCLDVIVSKHFGIEFVQLRRRPLSAKYVVCPVQL